MLEPDSDQTKALRAMTRARESLVRTRVGLANQLRDQLGCFWPGVSNVFWSVDSQIALAFLRRYRTPLDARGLGVGPEKVVQLVEAGDGRLVAEGAVWSSGVVPVEPAGECGVAFGA